MASDKPKENCLHCELLLVIERHYAPHPMHINEVLGNIGDLLGEMIAGVPDRAKRRLLRKALDAQIDTALANELVRGPKFNVDIAPVQ